MYSRISALEAVAQSLYKSRIVPSITNPKNSLLLPLLTLSRVNYSSSSSSSSPLLSSCSSNSSIRCSCSQHSHHHNISNLLSQRNFTTQSSSNSSATDASSASSTATTVPSPTSSSAASDTSTSNDAIPGVTKGGDLMIMLYTCRICETRSARQISKLGYYHGSVIVRCPGCKNLHLISDHLGWFDDNKHTNAETLLQQRGEAVRKGLIQEGKDEFVIELTEADRKVLQSRTKSVRLTDEKEIEIVSAGNYSELSKNK